MNQCHYYQNRERKTEVSLKILKYCPLPDFPYQFIAVSNSRSKLARQLKQVDVNEKNFGRILLCKP